MGLGNPGPQYLHSRHNVGFRVLDLLALRLARSYRRPFCQNYELAHLPAAAGRAHGTFLVKPLTYMNRSGLVLPEFAPDPENCEMIIVTDNMDLPPGRIRIRGKVGSAIGHNGLASVREHLGNWPRVLYLGIGRPEESSKVIEHVLGTPEPEEQVLLERAIERAVEGLLRLVHGEWQAGIDDINSRTADQ